MWDLGATPFEVEGKRVRLRRFAASDITDRYIAWLNDPEVVRYSSQRFCRHDQSTCAAYLASFDKSPNLFAAIVAKDGDEMIGTLTAYASPPHGTVDVGIMVGDKLRRGTGMGCDAWVTMIDWLVDCAGVRKVTAGTVESNHPMRRLMSAAAMYHEATRAQQQVFDGKLLDVLYFARFATNA